MSTSTSTADLKLPLTQCISVLENIRDRKINEFERYQTYLYACLVACDALYKEARNGLDLNNDNQATRLKLVEIINTAAQDIDLSYKQLKMQDSSQQFQKKTRSYSQSPGASPLQSPDSPNSPQMPQVPSRSHTYPKGKNQTATRHSDPMVLATLQCETLKQYLEKRIKDNAINTTRATMLRIDHFKRCEDIMRLANKQKSELDKKLLERQLELQEMAQKKVDLLKLSSAELNRQHKQILTAILLYEDSESTWTERKVQLTASYSAETRDMFCKDVLRCSTHPLSMKLQDTLNGIKEVVQPLYDRFNGVLDEWLSVPFKYEHLETSDEAILEMEKELDSSGSGSSGSTEFEKFCSDTKDEVKGAIKKTADQIKTLESAGSSSRKPTEAEQMIDDMDDLFDDDEEIHSCAVAHEDCSNSSSPWQQIIVNKEIIDDVHIFEETFKNQLKIIEDELLESIYTLKDLFLLAYDGLKAMDNEELVRNSICHVVFQDLSRYMMFLYRICNVDREKEVCKVMTRLINTDISHMGVPEELTCGTRGECYNNLIQELAKLPYLTSPLEVASKGVEIIQAIPAIATRPYVLRGEQKLLGADDILPIMCYIVLKSKQPRIASLIPYLDKFIPPEYMIDQEGYFLSTLTMTVEYLRQLKD